MGDHPVAEPFVSGYLTKRCSVRNVGVVARTTEPASRLRVKTPWQQAGVWRGFR